MALGMMLAFSACSPGETAESTTAPSTSIVATTTTSTTLAPSTTSSTTTSTTTTSTTTTTVPPGPEFPPAKAVLEHGGDAWAVYVAIAEEFDDPALSEATAVLDELGYITGVGDLGCDAGGAEILGLDPAGTQAVVAVYFETEEDGVTFLTAWTGLGHQVIGSGLVQTFCLD